jgi:pimeloyl-ACP methyl ester carboxylesterase
MKKISILFATIFILSNLHAQDIVGAWMGSLKAGAVKLRIVIHINKTEKGLTATFDSPDQKAFGLLVNKVELVKDSLLCEIQLIKGGYRASWDGKDALTGTFSQGPGSFPIDMKRLKDDEIPKQEVKIRPQTPKEPFGYSAEEVEYDNADKTIHYGATLTKPANQTVFPTVIIITGSGTQDRDGTMMGHKTYAVLADLLTKQGVAVLRVDDRGIGKSNLGIGVDPMKLTSKDFAVDVNNSIDYLLSRTDIDKKKIGLIGHSEGGMIAPMVAVKNQTVAFLVLLAGPGITGQQIWNFQMGRNIIKPNLSDADKAIAKEIINKMNEPFAKSTDLKTITDQMKANYASWKKNVSNSKENDLLYANPEESFLKVAKQFQSGLYWLNYFLNYQPAENLQKIKIPVLALNGTNDIQITSNENLAGIDAALKKAGNKHYQIKELQGLNHLFQTAKNKDQAYESIDETFSPIAATITANWILTEGVKK